MQPTTTAAKTGDHWIVRMNWKNRSVVFLLLALALGSHLAPQQPPAWVWLLLALQFGAYPQLLYVFTRRLPHERQRRVELGNMLLDAFCFGLWAAALGMPLWISYAMYIGVSMNLLVFESLAGWAKASAGMALGVGLVELLHPVPWQAATSVLTTALSLFTLTLYIVAFAYDGYQRSTALHRHRTQLRQQLQEIGALQTQLTEQAVRDPLTGLYNRRHLAAALGPALLRCQAQQQPAALLLLDIDHFKQTNDQHGHAVGDQQLQLLGQLLQRHSRPQDLACRYGGDEFLLLFTGLDAAAALERTEALRQAFAGLPLRQGTLELPGTLSCGLAVFPQHADGPESLMLCADQALYQAKLQGRNRVVLHQPLHGCAPQVAEAT